MFSGSDNVVNVDTKLFFANNGTVKIKYLKLAGEGFIAIPK